MHRLFKTQQLFRPFPRTICSSANSLNTISRPHSGRREHRPIAALAYFLGIILTAQFPHARCALVYRLQHHTAQMPHVHRLNHAGSIVQTAAQRVSRNRRINYRRSSHNLQPFKVLISKTKRPRSPLFRLQGRSATSMSYAPPSATRALSAVTSSSVNGISASAPGSPLSPFGPCSPGSPLAPFAPAAPGSPLAPVSPLGPAGPAGPVSPLG